MVKQLILCLALLCSPAWASWTCKDGASGCTVTTTRTCTSASTTCNITVASTTAGSVGIVCEQIFNASATTITVTGGGTWVTDAGSKGSQGTTTGECAHNLNMTGATTTITCTFSLSAANNICLYFNFTGTGSGFTFDVAGTAASASCTSCTGGALATTTANNYILVQVGACGGSCSAINQSYTGNFSGGDAIAYKINVSSGGTTPAITQTSGTYAGGGISIYEVVAGATCTPTMALMGVGSCG